jgi:hypothetical protein
MTTASPILPSLASALDATSLPEIIVYRARTTPTAIALRKKHLGRWKEYDWATYARRTAATMAGLRSLGVEPGDKVAIHAENRPAWVFADLAIQAMGATQRKEPVWRYWLARALAQRATPEAQTQALAIYPELAGTGGFYAQLALEALGKRIETPQPPAPPALPRNTSWPISLHLNTSHNVAQYILLNPNTSNTSLIGTAIQPTVHPAIFQYIT